MTAAENDLRSLNAELAETEAHERRYLTNDPTVEKLGELMNENPRGILLVRDELSGLLRSLDRQGREGDREFYLEAWNGTGRYTYDRIGRGTFHVDALCLSVVGGIQPGKLETYINGALKGGMGDDGLLQRFQVAVWPDVQGEWRNVDRWPNTESRNRAFGIYKALDELDPITIGTAPDDEDIPSLRFTSEAQELFNEWRGGLEKRLSGRKHTTTAGSANERLKNLSTSQRRDGIAKRRR